MLKIRTEQLLAFKEAMQESAQQKVEDRIRARCPDLTEPLSSAVLQAHIRGGMKKAPSYDLFNPEEAETFIVFRLRFGADFDSRLPWASNILGQHFKSGSEKIAELEAYAERSQPCLN